MAMHRKRGVPISSLFAPTMISNSSAEVIDPFGDGDSSESTEEAAEKVAEKEISRGKSAAEAAAKVVEKTGASPKVAVAAVREAEKKKRGRPMGSKNKEQKKPASVKETAAKTKPKTEPRSSVKIDAAVKKLLPAGYKIVQVGRGHGALDPKTGKKYSLKTGLEMAPAGRPAAEKPAKPAAAKPAAAKPAKPAAAKPAKPAAAKTSSEDKNSKVARAVRDLAQITGLKLAPSFRVDYGDHMKKEKALKKNGSEQAKLGPYTLTLLKNPVTNFEVAGVKVVPTVVGTAGVLTLEKLTEKLLPYVPGWNDMKPGAMKSAAPSIAVMGLAALAHWYADSKKMTMVAEACSAMFGFGFVLATSKVVDQYVSKAVDAVTPASTPAVSPPKVSGGAFADSRMSGGAFTSPSMAGYLARSSGYPNAQLGVAGSTGYPPVSMAGRNGADGPALARALSGGAFAKSGQTVGGHDTSELKDF